MFAAFLIFSLGSKPWGSRFLLLFVASSQILWPTPYQFLVLSTLILLSCWIVWITFWFLFSVAPFSPTTIFLVDILIIEYCDRWKNGQHQNVINNDNDSCKYSECLNRHYFTEQISYECKCGSRSCGSNLPESPSESISHSSFPMHSLFLILQSFYVWFLVLTL